MSRILRAAALTGLALAGALPSLVLASARPAEASIAVALSLRELVERSDRVVVATPKSRMSRWEDGRIVTYTTVAVDDPVTGGGKRGESVVIRTLGGVVGKIGQHVYGEAVLPIDTPFVLFIKPVPISMWGVAVLGSHNVVGMSQGAMPLILGADKVLRVGDGTSELEIVPAPHALDRAANVVVAGRKITDLVVDIRSLWATRAKN